MKSISVIMPCFNQAYHLTKVLRAYQEQSTDEQFEVIAINDASPDVTYSILTSFQTNRYELRVINQEKNQGPAAARNLGIQAAQSPLIVFVGDDILPERTFLQEHIAAHHRRPEVESAILGNVSWPNDMPVNSLMKHIDGIGAEQFSYYYFEDQMEYDYRHFYTANISIKRELLNRVDYWFDTDFPYAAYEDVELSYRLAQKGMKIYYDVKPVGYHYHYHHIWSFSERQYRAGLMALVLGKKHPDLRATVMGKNWLPHLVYLWLNSYLRPATKVQADKIESEMLRLVSGFEWLLDPIYDPLYVRILHYFYYKGIVQATFADTPFTERVVNSYTVYSLEKLLNWYHLECKGKDVFAPKDFEYLPDGFA
jgi:GT2 family glycosyltransferase